MFKTNFYTGEMSTIGPTEQYTTEAEATQNAGFGQYTVQPNYVPPTTYGLGGNYYQQQYGQPRYYQNPYMRQPSYGYNGYNNPSGYQQFYQQPQQQPQYTQMYIPPVNLSGNDYLLPANFEEYASDMLMRFHQEEADFKGKQIAERAKAKRENRYNPYSYNGFNYYGSPMYGGICSRSL
jgi:hypothetical protein